MNFANRITIEASASPGMGVEEVWNQAIDLARYLQCWISLDVGIKDFPVLVHDHSTLLELQAQYTVACERRAAEERREIERYRQEAAKQERGA